MALLLCSDFDLEAHIASLPVVDIEGVGRKNAARPKPKLKMRHHSENSALATTQQQLQQHGNNSNHCAAVTAQPLSDVSTWKTGSVQNNNTSTSRQHKFRLIFHFAGDLTTDRAKSNRPNALLRLVCLLSCKNICSCCQKCTPVPSQKNR